MKMDIEGAEHAALDGMTELSRRNPTLKLPIEFSLPYLVRVGGNPGRVFAVLQRLGFTRFFLIGRSLKSLVIPSDVERLASKARAQHMDLLCEGCPHSLNGGVRGESARCWLEGSVWAS